MKQQTAYKLLAAFLVLTMVFSIFAYIFISPRSETAKETENPQSQQEKYNPEFWTFNQPFYSISDALNMTPASAESASYADLESMTPQMTLWARQELSIINEADTLYKSNTTKVYYADIQENKNRSFLLLSTMYPERNDFEYIVYPQQLGNNYILVRQEQGLSGLYNIMGDPVILAPGDTLGGVLEITTSLNKTVTAYDQYAGLLARVEPAPYQILSSNVSFAKQYYIGIGLNNGSYHRTTAYLNLNSSTLKKLNQLKDNSTQYGLTQFNITKSGNYTFVSVVSPDLFKVMPRIEEVS